MRPALRAQPERSFPISLLRPCGSLLFAALRLEVHGRAALQHEDGREQDGREREGQRRERQRRDAPDEEKQSPRLRCLISPIKESLKKSATLIRRNCRLKKQRNYCANCVSA